MSAARATCSAPASASASTAVDGWVPLISASPSFGAESDRRQPGARERVGPTNRMEPRSPQRPQRIVWLFSAVFAVSCGSFLIGERFAFTNQHQREMGQRREVAAGADRAARRHARDGRDG